VIAIAYFRVFYSGLSRPAGVRVAIERAMIFRKDFAGVSFAVFAGFPSAPSIVAFS
jgi:hypothetical protein